MRGKPCQGSWCTSEIFCRADRQQAFVGPHRQASRQCLLTQHMEKMLPAPRDTGGNALVMSPFLPTSSLSTKLWQPKWTYATVCSDKPIMLDFTSHYFAIEIMLQLQWNWFEKQCIYIYFTLLFFYLNQVLAGWKNK